MLIDGRLIARSACLLVLASTAAPAAPQSGPVINAQRELTITAVGVVDDPVRTAPGGAWHFGTLMSRLAGDVPPAQFVQQWLETNIATQVVNTLPINEPAKALAFQAFEQAWLNGGSTLNLNQAPFRLLAIVNRPDLVKVDEGGVHSYGELRFVFGAYWPGAPLEIRTFFVIFEFDIPAASCEEVQQWANAWHALASRAPGNAVYNSSLQAITDAITLPHPGSGKPNGSYLKQLRTNEFELGDSSTVWNLREWNLISTGGPNEAQLRSVTTKQTPHFNYVKTADGRLMLREFLDLNRAAILAGNHVVPDIFQSSTFGNRPFQTGDANNNSFHPNPHGGGHDCCAGTLWWAPGYQGLPEQPNLTVEDAQVRHRFAAQTCSGCHFFETNTNFSMTSHRLPGQSSGLSPFLTGITIDDPVAPQALDVPGGTLVPVRHSFADLDHRASVLQRMLLMHCAPLVGEPSPEEVLGELEAEMGTRVH